MKRVEALKDSEVAVFDMLRIYSDTHCQGCKGLQMVLDARKIKYEKVIITELSPAEYKKIVDRAKEFGTLALPLIERDGVLITKKELLELT